MDIFAPRAWPARLSNSDLGLPGLRYLLTLLAMSVLTSEARAVCVCMLDMAVMMRNACGVGLEDGIWLERCMRNIYACMQGIKQC